MNRIKAVISDLDGTLIDNNNKIGKKTREAIRYLQKKDILFLPVTGRCYKDMWSVFDPLDITCPSVLLNGAQYRDAGRNVVKSRTFKKQTVQEVLSFLKKQKVGIGVYDESKMLELAQDISVRDIFRQIREKRGEDVFSDDWYETTGKIRPEDVNGMDILKIEAMGTDENVMERCRLHLQKYAEIEVTSSMPWNIEITEKGVDKAEMAQWVLKRLGILFEETLVFGDSLNDLCLFEQFKHTVAVENACPRVLEIAENVCGSCEKEGVAEYIFHHL